MEIEMLNMRFFRLNYSKKDPSKLSELFMDIYMHYIYNPILLILNVQGNYRYSITNLSWIIGFVIKI